MDGCMAMDTASMKIKVIKIYDKQLILYQGNV